MIVDELKKYSEDVVSGKIIACQKHRWACSRFLSDLGRVGSADFPYIFDNERADRFFRWTRLFQHRKGVLSGKKIALAPIQRFVFGNVYGWVHRVTAYRRFNKMYWQVGRKNGKSQSLAMVGTFETIVMTGNEASEVYCAATKTEQAKIVYDEAVAMLAAAADLSGEKMFDKKIKVAYGRITYKKNGSVMRTLSEEDRKTGDGLNPQAGIIDEYHAHEDSLIYDVIDSGMGARRQPLLAIITTAGFELNHPCYRVEYDLVSKILNPNIDINLENYFAMVNELDKDENGNLVDDIKNPATWEKANPIAASYPEGRDYLQKKLDEAIEAPEKMRNFLTKHLNIWVNQKENGYLSMEKWKKCGGKLPDLAGVECWIGLDLSSKLDLTSVGFEFKVGETFVVQSHSFIPAEKLEEKQKRDKVPFALWRENGWITATPGPVIDYKTVYQYIVDQVKARGLVVREICLDPWGGLALANDLIAAGFVVVNIIQGIKTLSEPTKHFREMVYAGRVVHDENPVLSWALSNAIADEVDRNQNILLNKKKSRERIDPIAALINAHVRASIGSIVSTAKEPRVFFA